MRGTLDIREETGEKKACAARIVSLLLSELKVEAAGLVHAVCKHERKIPGCQILTLWLREASRKNKKRYLCRYNHQHTLLVSHKQ